MGTKAIAVNEDPGSPRVPPVRLVPRSGEARNDLSGGSSDTEGRSGKRFIKRQLRLLPRKVARQEWEILFLAREMRAASTEVQRGVIREWLERSEGRKRRYLEKMERCGNAYRRLTGREPPMPPASPRHEPSLPMDRELATEDPSAEGEQGGGEDPEMGDPTEMLPPRRIGRLL